MAHTLLRDTDVMSMAHSLEVRVPFLDHILAEFVFALPAEWKRRDGQGKRVLLDAVQDMLPDEIVTRKKAGFDLPITAWLHDALHPALEETLHGTAAQTLFDTRFVEHLHRDSHYIHRLWPLFILARWSTLVGTEF